MAAPDETERRALLNRKAVDPERSVDGSVSGNQGAPTHHACLEDVKDDPIDRRIGCGGMLRRETA
jgi:hypothetical protein